VFAFRIVCCSVVLCTAVVRGSCFPARAPVRAYIWFQSFVLLRFSRHFSFKVPAGAATVLR
jgi:hypothetical protein